jgi:hypothetical protein
MCLICMTSRITVLRFPRETVVKGQGFNVGQVIVSHGKRFKAQLYFEGTNADQSTVASHEHDNEIQNLLSNH